MHRYLLPGLAAGPKTLGRLMEFIPDPLMDVPTHPGRFTPREVIAHLADWEPISRGRMLSAFATPGAEVPDLDELELAREKRYSTWDPQESSRMFADSRAETLAWLESLSEEDWSKSAVHTARGEMTIYDFANLELGHDMYHVRQLCEVIGRP